MSAHRSVPFARFLLTAFLACLTSSSGEAASVLKILFLGDNGHHQPSALLREIGPVMNSRGIQLVYTEDLAALTLENLKRYDAVMIYANIDTIASAQDQALLDSRTSSLTCSTPPPRNPPSLPSIKTSRPSRSASFPT